jgi:hypothetical protein
MCWRFASKADRDTCFYDIRNYSAYGQCKCANKRTGKVEEGKFYQGPGLCDAYVEIDPFLSGAPTIFHDVTREDVVRLLAANNMCYDDGRLYTVESRRNDEVSKAVFIAFREHEKRESEKRAREKHESDRNKPENKHKGYSQGGPGPSYGYDGLRD